MMHRTRYPRGIAAAPLRPACVLLPALLLAALLLPGAVALASPVEVVHALFERSGAEWHVSVTLRHADSGWEHYANLWVVETPDGRELGRRVLLHPHEDEQPFTRSATLRIPADVREVRVRGGDNVNGLQGNAVTVPLRPGKGERYEVR